MQRSARMKLANRIVEARTARNLSQSELARKAKLNGSTLYRIESGQASPNMTTLGKIAEALGMTVEELIEGSKSAGSNLPFPEGRNMTNQNNYNLSNDEKILIDIVRKIDEKNFIKNLNAYLILNGRLLVSAVTLFGSRQQSVEPLSPDVSHTKKSSVGDE